ncbi:MAG: carbonic anhydrase family protein, partial [Chloroflexi bacterium]
LDFFWNDTTQTPAKLIAYDRIAAGGTFDQLTTPGHEWVIKDQEGNMLKDYVATEELKQCVFVYPHFGYENGEPQEWAELSQYYEMCGTGQAQSPINLTNPVTDDLENIVFNYGETPVAIINNGHTIQVNVVSGNNITIDGNMYELKQFHFHAPSEHEVDGQHYPIEMHLVHKDANGKLAVVTVFIIEGAENNAFAPVWAYLPEEENGINTTGTTVQLGNLLPVEQLTYRYNGSLTTPPCTEGVLWSVMQNPVEMSAEQIAAFTAIIEGNNRPIQELNGRDLELDNTP